MLNRTVKNIFNFRDGNIGIGRVFSTSKDIITRAFEKGRIDGFQKGQEEYLSEVLHRVDKTLEDTELRKAIGEKTLHNVKKMIVEMQNDKVDITQRHYSTTTDSMKDSEVLEMLGDISSLSDVSIEE